MRKAFLTATLLALAATPALAQKPPTDQQVEAARAAMFQGEAQFFTMAAQRLQAQLAEAATREAATTRWWAEWWKGTYPGSAAPAPAAAPDGAPPVAPAPPKVPRGTKSP